MKPNARINPLLLAGFAALFTACQFTSTPMQVPTKVEQTPLPLSQVEKPSLAVVESLDSVTAYHLTLYQEIGHSQPDGSTFSEIAEYNYFWTHSEGQFGYNEHSVTTIIDPQSGTPFVMDETYLVDDLAFTYCPTCPIPAEQAGWSVGQRGEGGDPRSATDIVLDRASSFAGIPLTALIEQSVVIGDENINGIATTHYQLKDIQALSEMVRMLTGGAPDTPVEVTMAQMDTWLTVGDHQPIQFMLQAEGGKESIAGSQLLQPFTVQKHYTITEVNSNLTITVPTEVLTAVAAPLKELEIK